MTSQDRWRADVLPRFCWRPGIERRYEIWYGKLNYIHANQPCAFWFRYEQLTPADPGAAQATVWGIHFNAANPIENVSFTRAFALQDISVSADVLALELDRNAVLAWDPVRGVVSAAGCAGELRWDLSFVPGSAGFHYVRAGAVARLLSTAGACTPFEDVRYDGLLRLESDGGPGRSLTASPGMLGHIWGRRHPDGWCWLHANRFLDESGRPVVAALEALTLLRGPGRRPWTTAFLSYEGRIHEFNGVFDVLCRNQGRLSAGGYELRAAGRGIALQARARVDVARTMEFLLDDTDGSRLVNRNSSVADVELELTLEAASCRLRCDSAAALERVNRV